MGQADASNIKASYGGIQMEYGQYMWLYELNFLSVFIRLFLAMLFGGILGYGREKKHLPAGFRTYMIVCLGSALAMMAGIYLAGAILLLIPILINVAPNLKKYRPYANPLWFLPGLVMLAGIVVYGMMLASAMGQSAVQGIMTGIWSLNRVNTSMADAIGTLLIPLWMKLCAIEDLKPYEDMVGQMITPEQLEEKRKELGLANQKAAR
ncbi:MAG: hypothetical protein HFH98_02420 [Lachnospiraceae bacterium]|nr:hypothetical protein [Lachnospiraceae bacterium]